MPIPTAPDAQASSTRPYLIRALHDWCTDNGYTPYIAVYVDASVQVPMEYVKNHEIVLNVGIDATNGLSLGNEYVEFKARFGGVARDIIVPIDHVIAIYARENGQGMAFPVPTEATPVVGGDQVGGPADGAQAQDVAGAVASPFGLRLASAPAAESGPADAPADGDRGRDDEPPPGPGGGPRPSLKRVK
ncbi:ClpXP protease specificity-enhancing factor [Leptothrix discophora]|uniref:ClpXP protease specificity-enhancing factor n=1 Tax=Leptothrix discophora TaxID=89 RepID=A0ABT9G8S6_LEPDI|nr:ClpXP protease specificity-enhancing factor [Leptothrix discophora]MDP4302872.1 ClpXP protease specificity-enhancing factor [Leptothrix discophora]